MAKKANVLTPHLRVLHRSLGLANFSAFKADSSSRREQTGVERSIEAGHGNTLMTFCVIAGLDLYAKEPEWVPYGGTGVRGEDQIELIKEANWMAQADALVTTYEEMEFYVKNVTAEFLYIKRGDIAIENKWKQQIKKRFGKGAEPENTLPWFSQLTRVLAAQNCEQLFDLLFEHVPKLDDRVKNFTFGDLYVNHQAVEFIRHAKTHANGRWNEQKFLKLEKDVRVRVAGCVQQSFLHKARWYLPTFDQAKSFIAREAEFGQLIYDAISRHLNMEIDWTPGRDLGSVK